MIDEMLSAIKTNATDLIKQKHDKAALWRNLLSRGLDIVYSREMKRQTVIDMAAISLAIFHQEPEN